MTARESYLIRLIRRRVKELSARHPIWAVKIVGSGRQRKGLPDLRVVFYGLSLDVETKAGGYQTTPAQDEVIEDIRAAGGAVVVCKSVDEFDEALERLLARARQFKYCPRCRAPGDGLWSCDHCNYIGPKWNKARDRL